MNPRLGNPVLADRGARLAGVGFTERLVPRSAQPSQASTPCAEPAASPAQGDAVFLHFTESLSVGAREKDDTGPAEPSTAGLVLSEHVMILLRAVASYEQCSNEQAVALALAGYATKIGAGPLARAVLDERERLAGNNVPDDLGDLPDFVRSDDVRFVEPRKSHRNFQGMRR